MRNLRCVRVRTIGIRCPSRSITAIKPRLVCHKISLKQSPRLVCHKKIVKTSPSASHTTHSCISTQRDEESLTRRAHELTTGSCKMKSNVTESKFKSIRAQAVYCQKAVKSFKAGIGKQFHPILIKEQCETIPIISTSNENKFKRLKYWI